MNRNRFFWYADNKNLSTNVPDGPWRTENARYGGEVSDASEHGAPGRDRGDSPSAERSEADRPHRENPGEL